MALASQTARSSSSGHVYTTRRSGWRFRRRQRLQRVGVLFIAGAVVIASALWWMSHKPTPVIADASPSHRVDLPINPLKTTLPTPEPMESGFALTNAPGAPGKSPLASPRTSIDQATSMPAEALTMGEKPIATRSAPGSDQPRPGAFPPAPDPKLAASGVVANTGLLKDAHDALAANQPLVARLLLNRALQDPRADDAARRSIRKELTSINDELVFSPRVVQGDPLTEHYVIKPGDSLAKIVARQGLNVDWRLIQRINRISDPRRIRAGQTIKLVRGPFMAVIDKSDYRMDLYAVVGSADSADASASSRLYIRSFSVGIGKYSSTPVGSWIVRTYSKLINPPWTNPKTGKHYSADNPDNPIGERWIGLKGTDDSTSPLQGYGIHGTIDPNSIGAESSMGCIRLEPDDVDLVYNMLVEGVSRVEIVP